jgi:membrane fusion protein
MKAGASLAAGALVALGLFLWFGEYTSTVHVVGAIEPEAGAIRVVAPQFGRVAFQHVRNGSAVKVGQALFDLSGERAVDARIGSALAARREQIIQRRDATLQQLAQRSRDLADQQRAVNQQITEHSGALRIQDEQVKLARAELKRYAALAKEGYMPKARVAQTQNALNVELARRTALSLNLSGADRALLQVQQDAAALLGQGRIASTEAAQALAALEQETAEQDGRRAMRVAAPIEGSITAVAYKIGQSVPAGAPLATILPTGSKMQAVLQVPSALLPFMKPGQQVALRIDAFPYQKVGLQGGTVEMVDHSPINDGAPGAEPMYRVTVALPAQTVFMDGTENPLEAGMRLQAEVLGDRRRLIAWLFEPLIGATQRRPR